MGTESGVETLNVGGVNSCTRSLRHIEKPAERFVGTGYNPTAHDPLVRFLLDQLHQMKFLPKPFACATLLRHRLDLSTFPVCQSDSENTFPLRLLDR
jgi:hypothetical protein